MLLLVLLLYFVTKPFLCLEEKTELLFENLRNIVQLVAVSTVNVCIEITHFCCSDLK